MNDIVDKLWMWFHANGIASHTIYLLSVLVQ